MRSTSKGYRHWQRLLGPLLMIGLILPGGIFGTAVAVAGQVDANNVSTAPTIDGNLNESSWNLAQTVNKTTIGTPNNTVTMGASWNSTYLFVGVRVLDSNLFNDSANTWEDDSVEIYIDANNNKGTTYDSFDRQFTKGYNDSGLAGTGSQTGVVHAWAAISGGYSVEMAIPWSNLGVTGAAGLTMGFDVGYNDDDNAGTRDSQAVWWGTINNYNNTSAFGSVVLQPAGGTATFTPTNTSVPPTNTPTNTPVGPTNTPTNTSVATLTGTPTNTSVATNTPTNTPSGGQGAYPSGTPWAIPGTIQAENYDTGGENVAYHDLETANQGGQYRPTEGVDIETTSDTGGGFNVGWTRTNEWIEYTVNVASAGNYTLVERVASGATTGQFRVEFNGVDKTGVVSVPNTGGWQTYQNLSQTVSLSAGVQVMRIFFTGNDTNLNYFTLTSGGATSTPTNTAVMPTATPTVTRTPTAGPSPTPPSGTGVKGRTFAGYQAWFATVGDGSTFNQWFHWSNGGVPGPGNLKFELYPDVREYPILFQTNFANLGNGSPSKLFSAYTTETINLHFKWMKDNNIDGVGLQRFGTDIANPSMKTFRDSVTTKVRTAAEANGRNFYIMYDVSGMSGDWVGQIQTDWTNTMMGTLAITTSPMYSRENGKPVVSLWGIGFTDRPGTAQEWTTLITWFKNQNIYVIGGTTREWRTGANTKPGFLSVFTSLNMISPWTVGAYSTDADVDSYKNNLLIPDRDFTAANGIDYQPVIFPGFAWSNWNGGVRNQIPRRQGNLFWRQAYNLKSSNISTAYIAMFDEYDEGTAIAKAAEDSSMIPTNQYFLTLDADGVHLSSDFYLRLAGAANQMLKGQAPLTLTIPIAP